MLIVDEVLIPLLLKEMEVVVDRFRSHHRRQKKYSHCSRPMLKKLIFKYFATVIRLVHDDYAVKIHKMIEKKMTMKKIPIDQNTQNTVYLIFRNIIFNLQYQQARIAHEVLEKMWPIKENRKLEDFDRFQTDYENFAEPDFDRWNPSV